MSKWKAPLVTGLIFCVLLSLWYWDERRAAIKDVLPPGTTLLLSIHATEINSLALKTGKGEVSAEKNGEDWVITHPEKVKAKKDTILIILENLRFAKGYSSFDITDENQPKNFGLLKPSITATFASSDKSETLLIGDRSSTGRYFRDDAGRRKDFCGAGCGAQYSRPFIY